MVVVKRARPSSCEADEQLGSVSIHSLWPSPASIYLEGFFENVSSVTLANKKLNKLGQQGRIASLILKILVLPFCGERDRHK